MTDDRETTEPGKRRPTSMKSILRRTTGRTVPGSEPSSAEPAPPALEEDALPAPRHDQPRALADVPWQEIDQAVAGMCAQLRVPGAVPGMYDLYAAIAAEWGKAHLARK
jgi:hypothetical protein